MIPVISFAGLDDPSPARLHAVAAEIRSACTGDGAFQIVDHGIPAAIFDAAFDAAHRFFALPMETRESIRVNRHNRGYVPLRQTVYPGNAPDLKESFNIGVDLAPDHPDVVAGKPLRGTNQWPDLPGFRFAVEAYFAAMERLGRRLLEATSVALGEAPDFLGRGYAEPIAFMRLFHYPPFADAARSEHGAAEHTDYGMITLLAQDALGGLEVRARDGGWLRVDPIPCGVIVNVADYLSDLSNGLFRSPPHRVVNRADRARYSIPFFFDPSFAARYSTPQPLADRSGAPPRLADAPFGPYLLQRFDAFYKHRQPSP